LRRTDEKRNGKYMMKVQEGRKEGRKERRKEERQREKGIEE